MHRLQRKKKKKEKKKEKKKKENAVFPHERKQRSSWTGTNGARSPRMILAVPKVHKGLEQGVGHLEKFHRRNERVSQHVQDHSLGIGGVHPWIRETHHISQVSSGSGGGVARRSGGFREQELHRVRRHGLDQKCPGRRIRSSSNRGTCGNRLGNFPGNFLSGDDGPGGGFGTTILRHEHAGAFLLKNRQHGSRYKERVDPLQFLGNTRRVEIPTDLFEPVKGNGALKIPPNVDRKSRHFVEKIAERLIQVAVAQDGRYVEVLQEIGHERSVGTQRGVGHNGRVVENIEGTALGRIPKETEEVFHKGQHERRKVDRIVRRKVGYLPVTSISLCALLSARTRTRTRRSRSRRRRRRRRLLFCQIRNIIGHGMKRVYVQEKMCGLRRHDLPRLSLRSRSRGKTSLWCVTGICLALGTGDRLFISKNAIDPVFPHLFGCLIGRRGNRVGWFPVGGGGRPRRRNHAIPQRPDTLLHLLEIPSSFLFLFLLFFLCDVFFSSFAGRSF
mmetsp:Transcript_18295/g.45778  ORF Transcript_18295/g.45778 Transcript_18295/m.45778 type:complete len:501 (+) Transcript_18295:592-2094(+)